MKGRARDERPIGAPQGRQAASTGRVEGTHPFTQRHPSVRPTRSKISRPPISSLSSLSLQDRLRADVIERVRSSRTAILSRARGDGESPALLRDGVRSELADILAEEVTRAKRRRDDSLDPSANSDAASPPSNDATPERTDRSLAFASTSDDGMWNDDLIVKSRTRTAVSAPSAPASAPGDASSSPSIDGSTATWDETAARLTSVEYEDLMLAMHASLEDDLRREEAALLAAELENAEAEEAEDLNATVDAFEAWQVDSAHASGLAKTEIAVLCPVCTSRRVLATDNSLFCGCGNFRLMRGEVCGEYVLQKGSAGISREDEGEAGFGLRRLRMRLEDTYAAHAGFKGCGDVKALVFDVRDAFGVEALWAECAKCGYIETVM